MTGTKGNKTCFYFVSDESESKEEDEEAKLNAAVR